MVWMAKQLQKIIKECLVKSELHGKNYNLFETKGHCPQFCGNGKYGIQHEFRIFNFIDLQNEEDYEREESCSV